MMSNWKRHVEELVGHLPTGSSVAIAPMDTSDNFASLALQDSVTNQPMAVRLLAASLATVTDTPTFAKLKVVVVFVNITRLETIANAVPVDSTATL